MELCLQAIDHEGTPPRDVGDTYSMSTDPSDEEGDAEDLPSKQPGNMADDITSSQSGQATEKIRQSLHPASSLPSDAHAGGSRDNVMSDAPTTQDTVSDPAENAGMQEGVLTGASYVRHAVFCS